MGRDGHGVLGRWPGELPLSTKPREDPAAGIQGKGVGPGRRLGSGRDTGGMSRVTLDEAGQPARLEEKQVEDNLKGLKSLEASEKVEGTSPRMAGSAQGSGHSRSFPLQEEAVCGQEGAAG